MNHKKLVSFAEKFSKVFIFPCSQSLDPYKSQLEILMSHFLKKWENETNPLVKGSWCLFDQHFLIVFVDEVVPLSGCSKDSLYRLIAGFSEKNNLQKMPSSCLFFQEDSQHINAVSRSEFRQAKQGGFIDGQTLVYDTVLTEVQKLDKIILPCEQSWHQYV